MKKITLLLILLFMLSCGTADASPTMAVISTYSSSSWLPPDINKKACAVVDSYLANHYFAVVFDSSKVQDKNDMAKQLAQIEGSNVVLIKLTAFYDPPFTTTRIASDVKEADTMATVLMDYSVYLATTDRCITGRIVQRSIFPDTNLPLETAYSQAVSQALPKLSDALAAILK